VNSSKPNPRLVVLISADAEWVAVTRLLHAAPVVASPLGDWFVVWPPDLDSTEPVLFFHGGWGKIAAAASTQYVIDHWSPDLIINLGTCGGLAGEIDRGAVVLADKTVVYDIVERMGDPDEHIVHYATQLEYGWLGQDYPQQVVRTLLLSADRDLAPEEVQMLRSRYGAVAGDWESGAIAWVAARNQTPVLLLRGVTDLVSSAGGEAYDRPDFYQESAARVMYLLVEALPDWIRRFRGKG
jgi:adenosylhomocysteine nucleosidase